MAIVRTPFGWLKEYLPDLNVPAAEVARLLTLNGIETEVANERGEAWARIWTARVEKLERHPNSDRLLLATVDYGHGRKTVVTAATNLKEGDIAPFAEVGARLVDGETGELKTLEPARLRGVRSEGMVLSERELGLGEDHEGIVVLDPTLPVGAPLADVLAEPVLVSELRPNRADCLGVLGVAREVGALLDLGVREPQAAALPTGPANDFRITIEDSERCLRFTATFIRNVRVAPSPSWLATRLVAAGMRPINNVVDITNYVMLETGQPLHAFDRRRLRGAEIRVRRARPGETLATLDGVERVLGPDVLVVADAERAVGIAGIIGGVESEISPDTTEVVLEVAKWENRAIWRTAATQRLQTEAGKRFSWDISPELVILAQRRALRLLRELAGAEATGFEDQYPAPRTPPNIRLALARFEKLMGYAVTREDALDALRRVGCQYAVAGDTLVVKPPYWRTDVGIAEDVVEEIARIIGYERIPTHLPDGPLPLHEPQAVRLFREQLRDGLIGMGLQEIVSYPLIDPAWLEAVKPAGASIGPDPIRVTNPLSPELSVLRTTLVPSLLDTARRNLRWISGVALFEIGKRYLARREDLPEERETICVVLAGKTDEAPRHWLEGDSPVYDLFDLKGVLEALASAVGLALPDPSPSAPSMEQAQWYPLRERETMVGSLGQLDPRVAARWELPLATLVAELDLEALLGLRRGIVATLPSRFPTAYRDLSIVVEEQVSWKDVREEARSAAGKRLAQLWLLDLYRGPQAGEGMKSFAMRLVFQSDEGTLSEEEIERQLQRVAGRLERALGATIRA